jgi:hypothetical protein
MIIPLSSDVQSAEILRKTRIRLVATFIKKARMLYSIVIIVMLQ